MWESTVKARRNSHCRHSRNAKYMFSVIPNGKIALGKRRNPRGRRDRGMLDAFILLVILSQINKKEE